MDLTDYKYGYPDKMVVPPGSTYDYALRSIESGMRVLDVGSGPGHFASLLKDRQCNVTCVERNEVAAQRAEATGLEVLRLDIGTTGWSSSAGGPYDIILMLDVLEHLVDPPVCLGETKALLAEGGRLIASVPNVGHGAVSLPLLAGTWDYEAEGLLDESHVRFFVGAGFLDLLGRAGYGLLRLDRVYRSVSAELLQETSRQLGLRPSKLERILVENEGIVWQFVALCEKGGDGAAPDRNQSTSIDRSRDLMEELRNLRFELESVRRLRGILAPLFAARRRILKIRKSKQSS
ncbi:MAG: class I SAM-dependent methyltransferase [Thermoleophilia bacterium]